MRDARSLLRRVGAVLVVVGVLDIAVMIYCIATGVGYASSLNVFALAAGLFLLRGSLKAVRHVGNFAAFLLGGMATLLLAALLAIPISFVATLFRVYPIATLTYVVAALLLLAFLWWTLRNLMAPSIARALRDADIKPIRAIPFAAAGVALVLGLTAITFASLRTESAREALAKLKAEHGDHQRYFISSFRSSGGVVHATVTGYTDREVNTYQASWSE